MAENSHISWTTHTFNPWIGCTRVGDGCFNCYAEKDNNWYYKGVNWGARAPRRITSDAYWRRPIKWNQEAQATGTRPQVFCASWADVFEDHPDVTQPRTKLWPLIEATTALDWLLLTKRPENMLNMTPPSWAATWPGHVWAGTSVENQRWADVRLPHLAKVPAVLRFLSVEPLLGPVTLDLTGIGWVIVGGESGPDTGKHARRPMHLDWLASVVAQCQAAGVACWVKQDSAFRSGQRGRIPDELWIQQLPEVPSPAASTLW